MPVFKSLPLSLKGGALSLDHALLLRRMSLNFTPQHRNPFEEEDGCEGGSPASSLLDGAGPRDRSPFDDEEDENRANEGRKVAGGGSAKKGSLHFKSPLKTLGKLGKNLRLSGRGGSGREGATPPQAPGSPSPSASSRSSEKKKRGRRSSEGSLLRFAGKYRDPLGSRREGMANGEDISEGGGDSASRRISFMKMVGLGKKKEAGPATGAEPQHSQEAEPPEAPPEVKPREPLSVLEILQLVKKRDLLLADGHILELEQECCSVAAAAADSDELKDGGRRKAKDVELLYQELQKELWAVVQEALHTKTAGPNLGLVVQVLQQEEQVDQKWALSESAAPGGPRPRRLKQRWKEALEGVADGALPQRSEVTAGQLDRYLERLRVRMVEDLGAAKRNVVNIYPEDFQPFQVYLQSYHRAMTQRLQELSEQQQETCDVYFLLDFLHNIYTRDILQPVCMTAPPPHCQLPPLLPPETVDRLELDCLNSVRATVTTELSAVLDEEERRWAEPVEGEEFQLTLAKTVIQRLTVDLERSASVSAALGARVAQCTLNGLADFLYSFQKKVEMFHEAVQSGALPHLQHGYEVKTIALVNCCPPLRGFVRRCVPSEAPSEDSLRRANRCLDHIVQQGVQELTERVYQHIKPFFERLVRKKWLSMSEPLDQVVVLIRETFQRYRRLDGPPYQLLVSELHRRVLVEYLRAAMRGRLTCTSLKMRKKVAARLRDDGQQIAELFKDLESPSGWLDNALLHLSEMVQLEDIPALQMEVAVLVREFPDIRKKHVASILDLRGMRRPAERQEILNVIQDIESGGSDGMDGGGGGGGGGPARLTRDRAVFAEVPVTSEVRCLNLGLGRLASFFGGMRPRPRKDRSTAAAAASESPDDGL